MDRSAHVTRTPHGEENVNRLRVPEFGVRDIRLEVGGKSSKCHRPKQSPDPQPDAKGTDDFHFVPEKELLDLEYELFNPYAMVEEATLELYSRFDDKPLWKLDLKKLGADCLDHGKHVLKWDGRIVEPTAEQKGTVNGDALEHDLTKIDPKKTPEVFPDGYVTLEHTPHKLKLTLSSGSQKIIGNPATGWTYFHLLVKKIELELGPEEAIPAATVDDARHKRDKALRAKIESDGGIPADGSELEVRLISNTFREGLGQMDDDSLHKKYRTMWGDGARIPIVAKIHMEDSAGSEVKLDESDKGAVALGNVRFLWDWEDADENVTARQSTATAKAKAFITDAIDYHKDGTDSGRSAHDHTYPKGDNCHLDRGGKRGPVGGTRPASAATDALAPVFPKQDGYDPKESLDKGKFPFKVEPWKDEADAKRKWASVSQGWTSGKLKGKTGVLFSPARMAGDDYTVTCYLAYDKVEDAGKVKLVLDDEAEPLKAPAAIKAKTGKFVIWREVHVARYLRKLSGFSPLLPGALGGVQTHFERAYVRLEDKSASDRYAVGDHRLPSGDTPDYDKIAKKLLKDSGSFLFKNDLAVDSSWDHSTTASMFRVRTYEEFVVKVHLHIPHASGTAVAGDFNELLAAFPGFTLKEQTEYVASYTASELGAVATPEVGARLKETRAWLRSKGLQTFGKYSKQMSDLFFGMGDTWADRYGLIKGGKKGGGKKAPEGVTTVEFDFTHTYIKHLVQNVGAYDWCWYGKVLDTSDSDNEHCLIIFWEREGSSGQDKWAHEFGHNMYLPHASGTSGTGPAGTLDSRHDAADGNCLMSYDNTRNGFCGLCQLRMRGWKESHLSKTSASNKA